MARRFQPTGNPASIWWLTRWEETTFIADYDDISKFIENRHTWKALFEERYFNKKEGLPQTTVDKINSFRKRKGLSPIVFVETDIDEYCRDIHLDKAAERRAIREELANLEPEHRAKVVNDARAAAELLPPPHRTFEELMRDRELQDEIILQQRRNALPKNHTKPNGLDIDTARKMLSLCENDTDIFALIVDRLAPADLIPLAEVVESMDLRKALVRKALEMA